MKNITVYFDMDGVLARWNTGIGDLHKPGYFLTPEVEPEVSKTIHELRRRGFKVSILSAVYTNGYAAKEKKQWLIQNGLGDIPRTFVPYGSNKAEAVRKNTEDICVLVDDFTKNLDAWNAAGFTGIKFLNGINNTKGTWTRQNKPCISASMNAKTMADAIVRVLTA